MRVALRDRWWWPGFKSRARWFALGAGTAALCLAIRSQVPEEHNSLRIVLGTFATTGGLLAALQLTGDWPSREMRENPPWPAPTSEQRAAASQLTHQLNECALARTLPDGRTELVGLRDGIGYRYLIDADGRIQLVEATDLARLPRRVRRMLLGAALAVFCLGVTGGLLHDPRFPAWTWIPIVLSALVLLSLAVSPGPYELVEEGELWEPLGMRWGE